MLKEYEGNSSTEAVEDEIQKCLKEKKKVLATAVKVRESIQRKKQFLMTQEGHEDYRLKDAKEMLILKL